MKSWHCTRFMFVRIPLRVVPPFAWGSHGPGEPHRPPRAFPSQSDPALEVPAYVARPERRNRASGKRVRDLMPRALDVLTRRSKARRWMSRFVAKSHNIVFE